MFLKTLSGRFLMLTVFFVMLAEVLIFVPSVSSFRQDYLLERLERSQIASLALLATTNDMISEDLEAELLRNAGVLNIVLRRDEVRELVLAAPMPAPIDRTFDLRDASASELIQDAARRLIETNPRVIRVIGAPVEGGGTLIEITMKSNELRAAMLDYGVRIFVLSAVISVLTAALLFFAVRRFMVLPIKRVVRHMKAYEAAPEDARKIIQPDAGLVELHDAEVALNSMQTQLSQSLRQKDRLAQLGGAVAKISHDLRNILTTAQLLADRMEQSEDPAVQRTAPKLVGSLSRAVNLCERTLTFGKAEEPPPELAPFALGAILDDVISGEKLALADANITFNVECPKGFMLTADSEQIFRVISNLVRNARQALSATGKKGRISIAVSATEECCHIVVQDNGPGLPAKALEHIFQPFQGGARQGGTGLGLAIASELVRGHGGALELVEAGEPGTTFRISLPLGGRMT